MHIQHDGGQPGWCSQLRVNQDLGQVGTEDSMYYSWGQLRPCSSRRQLLPLPMHIAIAWQNFSHLIDTLAHKPRFMGAHVQTVHALSTFQWK